MKKNLFKIIPAALIVAVSMIPVSSALAEYNPDKEININEPSTKSIEFSNAIIIDNTVLEDAEIILSENVSMFPARIVFEKLGYTVEWQGDTKSVVISNLPQYITFVIGTDGYTIAKTAPLKLDKAPELINGITYVPVTLLSDLLEMDILVDENSNLIINTNPEENPDNISEELSEESSEELSEESSEELSEESSEELSEESSEELSEESSESEKSSDETNTIKSNAKVISKETNSILVNDEEKGEVSLNIGEDTEIIFENGTTAKISDIQENSELYVEYSEPMTLSLPPINNPIKIVIFK